MMNTTFGRSAASRGCHGQSPTLQTWTLSFLLLSCCRSKLQLPLATCWPGQTADIVELRGIEPAQWRKKGGGHAHATVAWGIVTGHPGKGLAWGSHTEQQMGSLTVAELQNGDNDRREMWNSRREVQRTATRRAWGLEHVRS